MFKIALFVLLLSGCYEGDEMWSEDRVDLGLSMQRQEAGNWCWAATAQASLSFFGEPLTQSEIVSESFGRECTPPTCNSQYNPGNVLNKHNLRLKAYTHSSLSLEDLFKARIERGEPIILTRRSVKGTINHMLMLGGYDPTGLWLYDPSFGGKPKIVPFKDLTDPTKWVITSYGFVAEK